MIHHERLRPPAHDYPADEWHMIEKSFHPEFLAQLETMLALGNGYLGMRGCPEEGGPHAENGTFINGFYETRPIVYGEEAYGFAKTGQTIVNVTDSTRIKLFVDDEPFWLPTARCLRYDRRLNMRSGTLDRALLWETPAGTQVLITSRRVVSFVHRHVAAISYQVTLLNAAAPVVIASEMVANAPSLRAHADDPRRASLLAGRVLQPRAGYAKARRIVLCHATDKSQMLLACATDHDLETTCPHASKAVHTEDFGQVAFTIEAQPGCPIHLTKSMVYHTSQTASPAELCGRAEWTLDREMPQGFQPSEVGAWQRAAERMYVPYDAPRGITLQDDSFLDREPWDFQHTPPDHYPLLLFYHPLDIYRKQVIKQADVVLAMFLLGEAFSLEAKQRNFAFYDPLTTGDSSLSSCIEAIIAAQVGDLEKATQYGMAALLMDLADVGGNVKDGCHIASMGGTWMMLTYGFGGLRDHDGTLAFWPRRPPEEHAVLRFPLTYRGQRLEVEIGPETVQYALRAGECLVIRHEQEEIQLTRDQPLAIRPVSRW